ncbi:RnfABCDGE type electron transport complex subunit D [Marinicella sp. S1101]|uniref:RnfABCDGE type electron transport complex subunit D n=1 Tax=Marinicella marina TaxID=2996016 RepID=UPI0022610322|nr:RnfABCDGE type electron transport complex subunit D [Marinicella marina]MCX7552660.1 RnfABCDGE type electron transport complex subunit D [Marinicella marina]MDJ1139536.1 RnfABCDGE type electron transport complex subunit D [Marinicella marina]
MSSTDVNRLNTASAPHIPARISVQRVMMWVCLTLLPATLAHVYYFGLGILLQMILAIGSAYLFEWWCLKWRQQPMQPFITDLSALVTAWLFVLCISPIAPWYVAVVGMFFSIVVAKHLFGGIGHNIFNPAMVGFCVILIAFPQSMSLWLPPVGLLEAMDSIKTLSLLEIIDWVFTGRPNEHIDAVTAATPLAAVQTGLQQGYSLSEMTALPIFGDFGGMGWEWIANWLFIGGAILLYKRIITWHVPAAVLMTTIAASTPFYLFNGDVFLSPQQHIFSGGIMLAAFFIATDPTSGCSSFRGKIIFGAGVAILTVLIRNFGAFPDGVAFAVLLMNMSVPLIDRLTIPNPYGKKSKVNEHV